MTQITATLRPSVAVIDEQAILNNIQHAKTRLKKGTDLFAVVKANAYGHGLQQVAHVAQKAGANGFCVAVLDEALALRQAHFTEPILVLGIISPQYAGIAAANDISVPLADANWLDAALPSLAAQPQQKPLKLHLAIDTGMGRIGFTAVDKMLAAVAEIAKQPQIFKVEGIFTHFSTADAKDATYFNQQAARFQDFLKALPEKPRYVHVTNSATSLWHDACNGNMIRYGVAMYGLNPSGTEIQSLPYPLAPALTVESELVFCKQVPAGTAISYGATYRAAQTEYIGTVPMGYADGWLRRMQGFHVLVDGQFCEMVGRVCMDQFMIRLPKAYPAGTKVVLVGESQGKAISLQDVADYAHTIHYEIACCLSARLPRKYVNRV